jgi:hypothetical protein
MATVPEDIKKNIIKLAEAREEKPEDLMARLKEIIETDETIQTMKNVEHKIRFAWAKLYGEYSLSGDVKPFYIRVADNPRPRRVEIKGEPTWVGDLVCIAQLIGKDDDGKEKLGDPIYCAGTLWRDAAKNTRKIEKGKVYKAMLQMKENSWGATVTGNKTTFTEIKDGHTLPEIKDFYENEIEPKGLQITIGEMDLNKGEHDTDIRIMEVMVVEAEVGESSDGNEFGRFTIMDDSIIGGNFTIFVAPQDVVWAQGSTLIFGGKIDINDDTGEIRWRNHFILPTEMAMSRELQVKSVKGKETVDVSEDAEKEEENVNEDKEQSTVTKEKEEAKEKIKEISKEEMTEEQKEAKEQDEKDVPEEREVKEEKKIEKKEEKPKEEPETEDDEGDIFKIDT